MARLLLTRTCAFPAWTPPSPTAAPSDTTPEDGESRPWTKREGEKSKQNCKQMLFALFRPLYGDVFGVSDGPAAMANAANMLPEEEVDKGENVHEKNSMQVSYLNKFKKWRIIY